MLSVGTDVSNMAGHMRYKDPVEPKKLTDQEFNKFRKLIYQETGISLSDHKRALVMSRLAKRLRVYGMDSYKAYYNFVTSSENSDELREMVNAITTNKTSFFREDYHFRYLESVVFPTLLTTANRTNSNNLRVWSAGCSTGEEPYSIAATAQHFFGDNNNFHISITATDIDTNVLKKAKNAIYPIEQSAQVPDVMLNKFFLQGVDENRGYFRAGNTLRSMIDFQQLNLNSHKWKIRGKFHIIFCRNVIIYFDKPTQKNLISRFISYLEPNGLLMLGHSESLHGHEHALINCGKNIYRLAG